MTVKSLSAADLPTGDARPSQEPEQAEKILCPHCKRTATNGIQCKGYCVADSDY